MQPPRSAVPAERAGARQPLAASQSLGDVHGSIWGQASMGCQTEQPLAASQSWADVHRSTWGQATIGCQPDAHRKEPTARRRCALERTSVTRSCRWGVVSLQGCKF